MSWTAPLSGVGGAGDIVDKLRRLELGERGGGWRVAEGAFPGSQRGSAGGVCRELGGASDAAGAKLAGSRILPAQAGGLGNLQEAAII